MRQHAAQVQGLLVDLRRGALALGDVGIDADEATAGQGGADHFHCLAVGAVAHKAVRLALGRQRQAFPDKGLGDARTVFPAPCVEPQQVFQRRHLRGEQFRREIQHVQRRLVDGHHAELAIEQGHAHGHVLQHVVEQLQRLLGRQLADVTLVRAQETSVGVPAPGHCGMVTEMHTRCVLGFAPCIAPRAGHGGWSGTVPRYTCRNFVRKRPTHTLIHDRDGGPFPHPF